MGRGSTVDSEVASRFPPIKLAEGRLSKAKRPWQLAPRQYRGDRKPDGELLRLPARSGSLRSPISGPAAAVPGSSPLLSRGSARRGGRRAGAPRRENKCEHFSRYRALAIRRDINVSPLGSRTDQPCTRTTAHPTHG